MSIIPGSFPAESDLPALRTSLGAMAEIAAFFAKLRKEDAEGDSAPVSPYPFLDAMARDLLPFPAVTAAIDRIIDRHG